MRDRAAAKEMFVERFIRSRIRKHLIRDKRYLLAPNS